MTAGGHTLPKTNIAPENGPPQKENHVPTIHFQGHVSFREGTCFKQPIGVK